MADGGRGGLAGFVLGRAGLRATRVGPVVAETPAVARALLAATLARVRGPAVIDLVEAGDGAALRGWLAARGFTARRRFERMYRGAPPARAGAGRVTAIAGPEFA